MCEETKELMITRYGWQLYTAAMKIENAKKLKNMFHGESIDNFIESNRRKMRTYRKILYRLLCQ